MDIKKKTLLSIAFALTISMIVIYLGLQYSKTFSPLKGYNVVYDTNQLKNELFKTSKNNKLEYEYYYNPNCKDCKKLEKTNVPKYLKEQKKNLIIYDTRKITKNDKNYLAKLYVTNTPTLIVRYKGYPIYIYSGTDPKIYRSLLSGYFPDNKKIPLKIPKMIIINNQETHLSGQLYRSIDFQNIEIQNQN